MLNVQNVGKELVRSIVWDEREDLSSIAGLKWGLDNEKHALLEVETVRG